MAWTALCLAVMLAFAADPVYADDPGVGAWAYYNTAAPLYYDGGQYYEALVAVSVPMGRRSRGDWATTQWLAGLHVNRFKLPWTCDEPPCEGDDIDYDTFAVTMVYGHRYYLAEDDFKGPGFGWLTAIGFYTETELAGPDGECEWVEYYDGCEESSGDTEVAVLDIFWTLRTSGLWVEPSILFGFERSGEPAILFVPGLRIGLAL